MPAPPRTHALPLWARLLLVLGLFFAFGLDLLVVVAAVVEGPGPETLLGAAVFGPMSLGWVWMTRLGLRRVTVSDEAVVVRNLLLSSRVPLADIAQTTHRGPLLLHADRGRRLRVGMLIRDLQTRILEDIEARSPRLQAARQAELDRGLPVTLRCARDVLWTNLVGGVVLVGMFGILAVAGAVHGGQSAWEGTWGDAAIGAGMGGLGGLLAFGTVAMLAFTFVWKWEFTDQHITARRLVGRKRFAVKDLVSMELLQETRYMKGVPRQAFWLEFRFTNDRVFKLQPTENGLPARFSPKDDRRILTRLERQLRPHYFRVSAQKDPPADPSLQVQPDSLAPIAHLRSLKGADRAYHGETTRDELVALPASATPALVAAARRELAEDGEDDVLDVILLALTDRGSPEAWPVFADALRHRAPYVRFVAACGLDLAAGQRFKVTERAIHKGHIDHDAVDARIPMLEKWWRTEGRAAVQAAAAAHTLPRVVPPREQRWNFIASNPTWVMEAGGTVHAPAPGSRLPVAAGIHVVGGSARLPGKLEDQPASIELDARTGSVLAAFVRGPGGWEQVPAASKVQPRFEVGT